MSGSWSEVHEERLVGHERFLLADPVDRLVGRVLREVVSLLGRLLGLHRRRALVDRGVVLVRLAADEAVEVLEPTAAGRPSVEGPHRARLPDRHLVVFAELRRRIAFSSSVCASGAQVIGRIELYPGAEVASSVITPIPTV